MLTSYFIDLITTILRSPTLTQTSNFGSLGRSIASLIDVYRHILRN